jgi:hypothetical protein
MEYSLVYIYCTYVRISGLNWIGRVNRMDSKRKLKCLKISTREVD